MHRLNEELKEEIPDYNEENEKMKNSKEE